MKLNKYKTILVVLSLFITSMCQAQVATILGGYLLNKALSSGQEKEFTAGKIVCNMFLPIRNGQLLQLPGWDPSTTLAISLPDEVLIQPVLFINGSRSPYEVQWAISDSRGPLVKQAYMKVDGGRRGKDGTADDNSGYRQDSPVFRVGDFAKGWFSIHASWGKGQSATIQAQRFDVDDFIRLTENPEALRALALVNGATTPSIPVFTVRMPDGNISQFTSQEEIQLALASYQQQKPPIIQEGVGAGLAGQGFEIRQSEPEINSTPAQTGNVEVRVYRYDDNDRQRGTKEEVLAHLASQAGMQKVLPFDADTISIPNNGDGIAILLFSTEEMKVEYRGDSGRLEYIVADPPKGGRYYSCLVTLTLRKGEKPTGKLLVTKGSKTRTYGFKEIR